MADKHHLKRVSDFSDLEERVARQRQEMIERIRSEGVYRLLRLAEIYSPTDVENELLGQSLTQSDWNKEFVVREMSAKEAENYTLWSGERVIDAYTQRATPERRSIVASKMASYDRERVIVTFQKVVLDGYHHLTAAILTGQPVRYIDLFE